MNGQGAFERAARSRRVAMSDGSSLRVLLHAGIAHAMPSARCTLMFVGGWCTDLAAWDELLLAATRHFDVVVFESREKDTSVLAEGGRHDLERISLDLKETLEALRVDPATTVVLASSWGTIFVAHGVAAGLLTPQRTVFLGPIGRLTFPPFVRTLLPCLPVGALHALKPLAKRWLLFAHRGDRVQASRAMQVLAAADFAKWKAIGRHVVAREYYARFAALHGACLVIYSRNDRFHELSETERIIRLVPGCEAVHVDRTEDMMSGRVVDLICAAQKKPHAP